MTRIGVNSNISLSSIFHIVSVPAEEIGPVNRISEDLEVICPKRFIEYERFDIRSETQFRTAMFNITDLCYRFGHRPILHFDMHGSRNYGLKIGNASNYISWVELKGWMRGINIQTRCNLMCVFATCYAFHMLYEVDLEKPSPYFILMAPNDKVSIGYIEAHIMPFYREIISGNSVIDPYKKHLSGRFDLFHAEMMMISIIAQYFKNQCIGSGRKKRIENLVSEFMANHPNKIENLASIRRFIRENIKPSQSIIEKYRKSFLLGRPCSVGIDDVLTLLR